jgi:hypothetical protein
MQRVLAWKCRRARLNQGHPIHHRLSKCDPCLEPPLSSQIHLTRAPLPVQSPRAAETPAPLPVLLAPEAGAHLGAPLLDWAWIGDPSPHAVPSAGEEALAFACTVLRRALFAVSNRIQQIFLLLVQDRSQSVYLGSKLRASRGERWVSSRGSRRLRPRWLGPRRIKQQVGLPFTAPWNYCRAITATHCVLSVRYLFWWNFTVLGRLFCDECKMLVWTTDC